MRLGQLLFVLLAGIAGIGWGTAAQALPQFTPTATARLHTLGSGQLGAEWNTGGLGTGGQLSYDSASKIATLTAGLNVLNWFDPSNSSCATDSGSNCAFNFNPNLDITLTASFLGFTVAPVTGTLVNVTTNFGTTGGVDFVVTDPTDLNSVQMRGSIAAGSFNGNPTTGLSTSLLFDTSTGLVLGSVTGSGFLQADPTTPLASLLQPDFFGITFGALNNFDDGNGGGLSAIVAATLASGTLGSFTAEANGQILNTASGQFVPEPATLLLLGIAGLAAAARRR